MTGKRLAGSSRLMALRILLATVGNYASCYALVWFIAPRLPMAPADAVLTASSLSFLLMVALCLWSFGTSRPGYVAITMSLITASALVSKL